MRMGKQNDPNIRGILFDKDGTLIDFNSIWIPLSIELVNQIIVNDGFQNRLQHKKDLLKSIGIGTDNKTLPGSIFVSGTIEDIAQARNYEFLGEEKGMRI